MNQHLKAPQEKPTSSNLTDVGWVAARIGASVPRTLRLGYIASQEAMMKVCGVVVAKQQGHSWTPTPLSGSRVNVGTISVAPSPTNILLVGGKARCRSKPSRWGGGPVVVRGRESRLHGEGVQRNRSYYAKSGAR